MRGTCPSVCNATHSGVFGIACLLYYFVVAFDIPSKKAAAVADTSTLFISRGHLRLGMPLADVVKAWGSPGSTGEDGQKNPQWVYRSSEGKITVTFSSDCISTITEEKAN